MFGVGGSDVIGQDEDARVRRYAAETLGRLGSATAEVLSYVLQLSETTGLDFFVFGPADTSRFSEYVL